MSVTSKPAKTHKTKNRQSKTKVSSEADSEANWVMTRRALLRHVKFEVKKRLGTGHQKDLSDFSRRYEKELKRSWKRSSQAELLEQIESSNLVYGGDFHALAQAQRTHLRLLRSLRKPVILALECFQEGAQVYLDQYLDGTIDLNQLRAKSKWDQVWGFSWDHYRPLFELAKAKEFRLLALNSTPSRSLSTSKDLVSREIKAAKVLAKAWAKTTSLVYVIFGDLHLAPSHLPGRFREALEARTRGAARRPARAIRELTIHLNSERVYFQLAKQGLQTDVDVVKFSEKSFCVLSTPPWVKWQSYLLFLDRQGVSDGDLRLDDETDFDATDQVALLVRLAAADLGLSERFKQINDLAVYSEDDETIWREVSRRTNDGERETAQLLLKLGQRFFIPKAGLAYQPKPTINSAASLAGLYLHARLSRQKRTLWQFPEDIRALIWTEAVSYFVSKMINHSRRSETVAGLETKLQQSENREALRLALDVRLSEIVRVQTGRLRPLQIRPRQKSSYVEATRILGGMLGERLYAAFRSRKLKRDTLITWLEYDPGSRAFHDVYDGIVERVASW
jgi:uncharacterized iron-regulated protein